MAELIDHETKGIARLATQYRESTNLINYIRSILKQSDELEQVFQDLLTKRSIDTAEGIQLDIIGDIVGQSRQLIDVGDLIFFGLQGVVNAGGLGDLNDPSLGARLASLDEPTSGFRTLNDEEYRLFIRAKILRNHTRSTIQEIIDAVKFITDATLVVITEGTMSYIVNIGKDLTPNEEALIVNENLVPKTAAVGVAYTEIDPDSYFGLEGVTGAKGLGDLNNPALGGKLASLLSGQGALSPTYNLNMVRFTDTDPDYLQQVGSLGITSDITEFTFSAWVRIADNTGRHRLMTAYDSVAGDHAFMCQIGAGPSDFQVGIKDNAGVIIASLSGSGGTSNGVLYHVLISYNSTDGIFLYIDDVLHDSAVGPLDPVGFSVVDNIYIGTVDGALHPLDGDLGDIWFDDTFIDLSVESNRRKFIDVNGNAISLGNNGQLPTGNDPLLYFGNGQNAGNWNAGTNLGVGGNFVMNGEVTDV